MVINEPEKTTIFRAVRELLINVAKHAGCDASRIHCLSSVDKLSVSVIDQGNGFSPDAIAAS